MRQAKSEWFLKSSRADDFASACRVQGFEDFSVGHTLLAQELPLLVDEAVRVEEHRDRAFLFAGGCIRCVLELWSGWFSLVHLAVGLISGKASQYLALSGITNRIPPLGSGTSPA